jgi:membrane protein implicated in regulation of membrane protease activity
MNIHVVFWYWWILAAVLFILEMTLPGIVFLFLAIGAVASGALLAVLSEASLEAQLAVFAMFSVVSALALRPTLRRWQGRAAASTLNARADALVGKTFILDSPILAGRGRVKLGDGSWIVTGPDMVAGARVRVAAVNGTELAVEPAP